METQKLVAKWFELWDRGKFLDLPVTDNFKHTSPFGTIRGKKEYLRLVEANRDKFLGYKFEIHDSMYGEHKACVRYTGRQGNFSLDVSEWYYFEQGSISEIIAHYHIGEIRQDRELADS